MKWPKAAGTSFGSRLAFVSAGIGLVGLALVLIATFVLPATADRAEAACAAARAEIAAAVGPMGNYRGDHPCVDAAREDAPDIWDVEGVYRSGLTQDVQPSIPFAAVLYWDDDAEAFRACHVDYWPGGEETGEPEMIVPDAPPAGCPA